MTDTRQANTTIHTAQIRYKGAGRVDVTVKSARGQGRCFAPTWDMVMSAKRGEITEAEYTERYLAILEIVPVSAIDWLLSQAVNGDITLVCYCKPGAFCHRVLLAKWLESRGYGSYVGEREVRHG